MRTRPDYPFNKSLLAAAVIIASGCATTAPESPKDTGFSGPLVDAGHATAGVTSSVLKKAGYALGLHDDKSGPDTQAPLDEVDQAMMEEDALPARDEIRVIVADVDRATVQPMADLPVERLDEASDTAVAVEPVTAVQAAAPAEPGIGAASTDEGLAVARFVEEEQAPATAAPATNPSDPAPLRIVAINDYTHVVGSSETLWEIARTTTGDATNWHALAEVNNLGQNAAIQPGQDLLIPADMLRPELVSTMAADAAEMASQTADPADAGTTELTEASPAVQPPESPTEDARGFTVESGESLWEFARRTTGDATEWQVIAAHNGFDEQRARAIREGEEIFVPEALVRAELGGTEAITRVQGALQPDRAPSAAGDIADADADEVTDTDEPGVSPRMVPIAEAASALPAEPALAATTPPSAETETESEKDVLVAMTEKGSSPGDDVVAATDEPGLDETRDMTIVEASFNEPVAEEFMPDEADAPDEITISGTYYPKAVYNQADFSSSLLMRVSPGTTLRVAGVEGPWYVVEVEGGQGYVHDRDIK